MARLAPKSYPLPEPTYGTDWRDSAHEKAMEALLAKSDALPDGEIVGAVLRFPHADSAAYYVVTKAEPLTLAHVPYSDAWQVEPALIRGLRKDDVLKMQWRRKGVLALFTKK